MKRAGLWVLAFLYMTVAIQGMARADATYRIGVSDVVSVNVYGHPELSAVSPIAENGSITLPALGSVSLEGLTSSEAARRVESILRRADVVKEPQVGVVIEQYRSRQVTILGQVAQPGVYAITRDSKVTDMISQAGGLTEDAGDVVILTRSTGEAVQKTLVDFTAHLEGRADVPEPSVMNGDRIFVPRMEQFYVYGEVNKPGAYRFQRGMTVMQALSVAGGISDIGTDRGIRIRRKTESGVEQEIPASLTQQILPSDTLQVKESLF